MASIDSIMAATGGDPTMGAQLPGTKAQSQKNQFLQLLVAQLKGQNPLDPLDGTQFVSQLAQFSSLEELTNINEALQNVQNLLKPTPAPSSTTTKV